MYAVDELVKQISLHFEVRVLFQRLLRDPARNSDFTVIASKSVKFLPVIRGVITDRVLEQHWLVL